VDVGGRAETQSSGLLIRGFESHGIFGVAGSAWLDGLMLSRGQQ
jgi:hypothetical protein